MKVAILGYSTLEQSESVDAYHFYKNRGDEVVIYYWEGNTASVDVPTDVETRLCPNGETFEGLDEFDLVVRGAGIHPKFIHTTAPVTTIYNEFMAACPAPVIGITGTKGKGTTSTLIAKILEAAGNTVFLGGNIGKPPLSFLNDITPRDWVVLELSSFQLMDFTHGPQVGVCIMVVPEHLNWHADMQEYLNAKSNLFKHQPSDGTVVCNALNENSRQITSGSPANTKKFYAVPSSDQSGKPEADAYVMGDGIFYGDTRICDTSAVALLGRHNLENICAAIAATWNIVGGNVAAITSVITTFTGLEHRLEFVRELDDVRYYDDSFSTTPETAIAAIRAFDQPKIVILGGISKGIPFDELTDAVVAADVKHVLAIGQVGPEIAQLLRDRGYGNTTTENLGSMTEIVSKAREIAGPGDVVLLSTGCASFDMFTDYKDRGNQFKSVVAQL